jgi:hypothetical protein
MATRQATATMISATRPVQTRQPRGAPGCTAGANPASERPERAGTSTAAASNKNATGSTGTCQIQSEAADAANAAMAAAAAAASVRSSKWLRITRPIAVPAAAE